MKLANPVQATITFILMNTYLIRKVLKNQDSLFKLDLD